MRKLRLPRSFPNSAVNPRDRETTPVNPESTQTRLLLPAVFGTIESVSRSASTGEKIDVLTFFEYLRQRAHQSILSGAQQALEDLEGKAPDDDGAAAAEKLLEKLRIGPSVPSSEPASLPGPSTNHVAPSAPESPLPPPRRRGRPRNARPDR